MATWVQIPGGANLRMEVKELKLGNGHSCSNHTCDSEAAYLVKHEGHRIFVCGDHRERGREVLKISLNG